MSVLEKATEILDVVADQSGGATLTSIAQRLGQPRSSTHRLLSELVQLGLLFRVGPANYAPGPRLARWGEAASGVSDIVRISKPTMVRLRDAVGESVHLYVRQRDRRVCVVGRRGQLRAPPLHRGGKAAAPVGRRIGKAPAGLRGPRNAGPGAPTRGAGAADRPRANRGGADGSAGASAAPSGRCRSGSARRGWPRPPCRSGTRPARSRGARDLGPDGRLDARTSRRAARSTNRGGRRDQPAQGWSPPSKAPLADAGTGGSAPLAGAR